MWRFGWTDTIFPMREILILFVHLIVTVARLAGPGGIRSVVAESVLVRHQLLILHRGRKRAPNLCTADRILAGLCALFRRCGNRSSSSRNKLDLALRDGLCGPSQDWTNSTHYAAMHK
jgi:hypothetical protein